MIPAIVDMMNQAPDLKWDDYDVDIGFRCDVENITDFDRATCLMPLPVDAESYLRGEYRWRPNDREKIV